MRLADGRVLLSWSHRSNIIDDDGFGTGVRALISHDDGLTFDFSRDYFVLLAKSDDFCSTPVPWKGEVIELCCAPAKGGCGCNTGFGYLE